MGERLGGSFEGMHERARRAGSFEARLDAMAMERGREIDVATPDKSAEWILFQRMLYLLAEEAPAWDPQQRASLRKAVSAYGAVAFPRFTDREQNIFADHFMDFYQDEKGIELNRTEVATVARLGSRVGLSFNTEPTTVTFIRPEKPKFRRITEVEDATVTNLLEGAPADDKIGYILGSIAGLSLKQKVKLLLSLSDGEYAEFKIRRREGFDGIVADILANADLIADKAERIKALSRLRHATPRYEVEADIRRRWNGKYPAEWDQDLEEDTRFKQNDGLPGMRNGKRITYEEAVEFARFENARKFYRGSYFPSVTRRDDPLPISIDTLYEAFQAYRKQVNAKGKPGTDISMKDLLGVIDYYLGYEPDNKENCDTHRRVQSIAQMITAIEDAIEG